MAKAKKTTPTAKKNKLVESFTHFQGWILVIALFIVTGSLTIILFPKTDLFLQLALAIIPTALITIATWLAKNKLRGKPITILSLASVLVAIGMVVFAIPIAANPCNLLATTPEIKQADPTQHELLVLISPFSRVNGMPAELDPEGSLSTKLYRFADDFNAQNVDYHINVIMLEQPQITSMDQAKIISRCLNTTLIIWGDTRPDTTRYVYTYTLQSQIGIGTGKSYQSILPTTQSSSFNLSGAGGDIALNLAVANLYLSSDDLNQSLVHINNAISQAEGYHQPPSSVLSVIYDARGWIRFISGDSQKALEDTTEAIRLNPNNDDAFNDRGIFYDYLGNTDLALQDLNQAIKLNPQDVRHLLARATIYINRGEAEFAIKDMNHAVNIDSDDYLIYYTRGFAYTYQAEYQLALKDLDKSIQLYPGMSQSYETRAIVHGMLNKPDLALRDFNFAITLNPYSYSAYYGRSLLYRSLGKYTEAEADLKKVKELGYSTP